jgi:general secretion pathway protein L
MSLLSRIESIFQAWTSTVAETVIAGIERFVSPRAVRLVEGPDGTSFAVEAAAGKAVQVSFANGAVSDPNLAPLLKGSRLEFLLQSRHFMYRPLELPARAADFLDGIIRAQIDRLTPWSASEAAFGFSKPAKIGAERFTTTIVATSQKIAAAYVDAFTRFHPASIAIYANAEDGIGRVKVFEHKTRGRLDRERLSRVLLLILIVAALSAILSAAADTYVTGRLEAQRDAVDRQITQRRLGIREGRDATGRSPVAAMERRKNETAATVVALDALSQALPDHTYVTELHIEGRKLQVVGITRDAPSLIRLIEQSPHFTRATFFAPTTRAPSDPGDRFHIEAQLQPINSISQ